MVNEKRLIDANPLMQSGWHLVKTGKSNEFLASMSLADVQTVDAVEVVHGQWINNGGRRKMDLYCSACNRRASNFVGGYEDWWDLWFPNYCPNCGAKMDGGN